MSCEVQDLPAPGKWDQLMVPGKHNLIVHWISENSEKI